MSNFKRTFAFIFFMLSGIALGGFIAHVCNGVPYLSWLAWGKTVGFDDFTLDLSVIKLNLGLKINITISLIITIAASLFVFSKTCKNL